MQTPKGSRTSSVEVPQRKSPATPRTARQLKIPGSDSEAVSSPNPASKTPKDRSPKVTERKVLRSPVAEKKRPSRVTELESQLTQLQDDLKKTKDQLTASESWKRRAMQEAEEAKKQLSAMSAKLEESEQQLMEISASEDDRVQELRKLSQDRDRAWQSELEAVQKQHSMDSAALASAMNEIQKLKVQLEKAHESEALQTKHAESAHTEIQNLRIELTETLSLVQKLKSELTDCRESESQALEVVHKTQTQLEAANKTIEMQGSDATKETKVYNTLTLELEQSKARVKSLEGLVSKLQAELIGNSSKTVEHLKDNKLPQQDGENEGIQQLNSELKFAKLEVNKLRSALDAAEVRYQEEYIRSTLQIRGAYEQVERIKAQSCQREAELEEELKKTKADADELRANLMDKETEKQSISEEIEELNLKIEKKGSNERESELAIELKKLEADLTELKANLTAKETELQSIREQNGMLKTEIMNMETGSNKVGEESVALLEAARSAEREALMKVGYLTEEADKSSRRAARATEQLDAAQEANTEMEAELRRLKVQLDQWRKAAEAATAMLSSGNKGKHSDKTKSVDSNYNPGNGSPNSEDMDDDSPKKKNGNMLKKIGVLWKRDMSEIKLVLVGVGGVGKSALTITYVSNVWVSEYDPTIEDSHRKQVAVDDIVSMLDILDTAGQEEYSSMQDQWFRQGHGFLVVYSIINKKSFLDVTPLRQKIERIQETSSVPMVLVGNKCDLEDERVVQKHEGEALAKQFNCPFFEASAKDHINVDECFRELVREVRKKRSTTSPPGGKDAAPSKDSPAPKKKSGCFLL